MLTATVAMSLNRAIGKDGKIPWHVSDDLKWFKELTWNKTIVIGSNTYLKLPPIKNRKILVLSSRLNDSWYNYKADTCLATIKNKDEILELSKNREIIVAGGAKVYEGFLPYIDMFYVTHINGHYDGDVHMPMFEHLFNKKEVIKEFGSHQVIKYSK